MKKCAECKRNTLVDVDDIVNELDGNYIIAKGKRCTYCGEEYLDEFETQRMILLAKRLGIWGEPLKLHRKISRSARGMVLRIPSDIEKELHLKGNEDVRISKVGPKKILMELD